MGPLRAFALCILLLVLGTNVWAQGAARILHDQRRGVRHPHVVHESAPLTYQTPQFAAPVLGALALGAVSRIAALGQQSYGGVRLSFRHRAQRKNSIAGPGFWSIAMALSRQVPLGATRTVQLRIEVFNLLNTFNLGLPANVLDLATFGRITTMTGSPRIMQFGVKYGF